MLGQNTDLLHEINITANGEPIDIELVEKVEFSFDDLKKYYPSESVKYENGKFYVRLTQEETLAFDNSVQVQVRIKFNNGDIPISKKKNMLVNTSLSKEFL